MKRKSDYTTSTKESGTVQDVEKNKRNVNVPFVYYICHEWNFVFI